MVFIRAPVARHRRLAYRLRSGRADGYRVSGHNRTRARAEKLIESGQTPIVVVESYQIGAAGETSLGGLQLIFTLANAGPTPALHAQCTLRFGQYSIGGPRHRIAAIHPFLAGDLGLNTVCYDLTARQVSGVPETHRSANRLVPGEFLVSYHLPTGQTVEDVHRFRFQVNGPDATPEIRILEQPEFVGKRITGMQPRLIQSPTTPGLRS